MKPIEGSRREIGTLLHEMEYARDEVENTRSEARPTMDSNIAFTFEIWLQAARL
ncbi:hypothetical protein [Microvirga yunnanensis]|uniref:hypothetical protein n=1 Tax=Microvirga yunnanensis TaxID=2953740 RepID=UPI0021C57A41|nr:hypothetical protein [Microvirga sp. HBU65207]